jgi:hypothetical protein
MKSFKEAYKHADFVFAQSAPLDSKDRRNATCHREARQVAFANEQHRLNNDDIHVWVSLKLFIRRLTFIFLIVLFCRYTKRSPLLTGIGLRKASYYYISILLLVSLS